MDWGILFGALIAIGVTTFSTFLNERALRVRTDKQSKAEASIYRSLLETEFYENQSRMRTIWLDVQTEIDKELTDGFTLTQALIYQDSPAFSDTIWLSHVDRIGAALTRDEAGALLMHYTDLRRIREWHMRLRSINDEDQVRPPRVTSGGTKPAYLLFERTVEREWPEFRSLVESVLARQSPLEDRSKPIARA